MKSSITKKVCIGAPRVLRGNIAYTTPKGFCVFTHWQTFYYVYPRRKRTYSLLYAHSFDYSNKSTWK